MRVLVINGPNLNMLGQRQIDIYGRCTLSDIERAVTSRGKDRGVEVVFRQSNSEADLLDWIQTSEADFDGLILNPGGLTHYSVSLLDALLSVSLPCVEVHLSNLAQREPFRQDSLVARGVVGRVEGFGAAGYELALDGLLGCLSNSGDCDSCR